MKMLTASAAAGLAALLAAGAASAQGVVVEEVPEGTVVVPDDTMPPRVVITPEQRTVIREYVTRMPVDPLALPDVELRIGEPLPDTVKLHPIEVPEVEYRYVVIDGHTVIVDPETREIVEIMD